MLWNAIKYNFWNFAMNMISVCFELFVAYLFWGYKGKEPQIISMWLLCLASIQIFVGLRLISRKKYLDTKEEVKDAMSK